MSKIWMHTIIAGLLAASAGISPASAQVGRTRIITPAAVIPSTGPIRSRQSTEPDETTTQIQVVPRIKRPTTVGKLYYCDVELVRSTMGQKETPKTVQFTISPLADGSFVYGGSDPFDTSRRYSLVDKGEWRVMTLIGWIEGKEPAKSKYSGMQDPFASKWSVTPRIHKNTGEFSAQSVLEFNGVTNVSTYAGKCTGGV